MEIESNRIPVTPMTQSDLKSLKPGVVSVLGFIGQISISRIDKQRVVSLLAHQEHNLDRTTAAVSFRRSDSAWCLFVSFSICHFKVSLSGRTGFYFAWEIYTSYSFSISLCNTRFLHGLLLCIKMSWSLFLSTSQRKQLQNPFLFVFFLFFFISFLFYHS